jgi:hypothetical protein
LKTLLFPHAPMSHERMKWDAEATSRFNELVRMYGRDANEIHAHWHDTPQNGSGIRPQYHQVCILHSVAR